MALTDSGLYVVGRDGESTQPVRHGIFFYDVASRRTTRVSTLAKPVPASTIGLAISPDRRALLFTQRDASGADLMLLENFR